jgi:hypothetical protein
MTNSRILSNILFGESNGKVTFIITNRNAYSLFYWLSTLPHPILQKNQRAKKYISYQGEIPPEQWTDTSTMRDRNVKQVMLRGGH